MTPFILESNHKKIGIDFITNKTLTQLNSDKYKSFIKITRNKISYVTGGR